MKIHRRPFSFLSAQSSPWANLLLLAGILAFLGGGVYLTLVLLRIVFARGFLFGLFFVFFVFPFLWRFVVVFLVGIFSTLVSALFSGTSKSRGEAAAEDDVIDVNYKVLDEEEHD